MGPMDRWTDGGPEDLRISTECSWSVDDGFRGQTSKQLSKIFQVSASHSRILLHRSSLSAFIADSGKKHQSHDNSYDSKETPPPHTSHHTQAYICCLPPPNADISASSLPYLEEENTVRNGPRGLLSSIRGSSFGIQSLKKNGCETNKFIPGKYRGSNRGPLDCQS